MPKKEIKRRKYKGEGGSRMGERTVAMRQGKKRYHGRPCKTCSETLKYTSNGSCFNCNNNRNKARFHANKAAK